MTGALQTGAPAFAGPAPPSAEGWQFPKAGAFSS